MNLTKHEVAALRELAAYHGILSVGADGNPEPSAIDLVGAIIGGEVATVMYDDEHDLPHLAQLRLHAESMQANDPLYAAFVLSIVTQLAEAAERYWRAEQDDLRAELRGEE